jgi:hypothetical protein
MLWVAVWARYDVVRFARGFLRLILNMNPYWLMVAFALLTQFYVFLRWLHRRMRDAEISRIFLCDIAASHLPHIYQALQLIAEEHGIGLPEAPPVRFMEMNASDGISSVLRARPGRPRPPAKSPRQP